MCLCATGTKGDFNKQKGSQEVRQMRDAAATGIKVTAGGVKSVSDKTKELVK